MDKEITSALIGAATAYFVLLIEKLSSAAKETRQRRAVMYAEAFKAALAWREMVYRVRRRMGDEEPALRDRFHELQESIDYYQAWIATESKELATSYCRLVKRAKEKALPLLRDAWDKPPTPISGDTSKEPHMDLSTESDAFLEDVRKQLSPRPWHRASKERASNKK